MTNKYFKIVNEQDETKHLVYKDDSGLVLLISPQTVGVKIEQGSSEIPVSSEVDQEEWDNTLFWKWNFDVRTTVALNSRAFTPVTKVSTGHNTAVAA